MIAIEDLANFGRSLVASADASEVQLRTGAGRMYYAAFHRCAQTADERCNPLCKQEAEGKGMHAKVFLRLQRHCHDKAIQQARLLKIYQKMREMRELRNHADYKLNEAFTFDDAREMQQLLFEVNREFRAIDREVESAQRRSGPRTTTEMERTQ